jgi:hypothetical protein
MLGKKRLITSSDTEDAEENLQMPKRRRIGNDAKRGRGIAEDDAGSQGDVEDGMELEDNAEQVSVKTANAAKKTANTAKKPTKAAKKTTAKTTAKTTLAPKTATRTKAAVAKTTQAPVAKTTQASVATATSQTIASKKATTSKTHAKTSVPNTRSVAKAKAASGANTSKTRTPFKIVYKPGTLIDQKKSAAQTTTTESVIPRVARKPANISKASEPTDGSGDDHSEQVSVVIVLSTTYS